MENPEYQWVEFNKAKEFYRLAGQDCTDVFTMRRISLFGRGSCTCISCQENSILVQRTALEKISIQKGTKPNSEFQAYGRCVYDYTLRPGIIDVPYITFANSANLQVYSIFSEGCCNAHCLATCAVIKSHCLLYIVFFSQSLTNVVPT